MYFGGIPPRQVSLALEFIYRRPLTPAKAAVFPGAWNPPTVAHLAIARAALSWADEVVWVLPAAFPHKAFEGASFAGRRSMIGRIAESHPRFSAAVSQGGLYAEIAREARGFFTPETEIGLVCGRDAADRIAAWDYGEPGVFERLLEAHPLLVAARAGEYSPPERHRSRIVRIEPGAFDDVSSTEIRRRIAVNEAWRHLVPAPVAELVEAAFPAAPVG